MSKQMTTFAVNFAIGTMKVLKFGGTSVGTAESLTQVKQIVSNITDQAIVVVSALGGVTDMLISTAHLAANNADYHEKFTQIKDRHIKMVESIVPPAKQSDTLSSILPLLEELGNIYKGVALIKDLSSRTLDVIVGYGERLSSAIISRVIEQAALFDSRDFIKTECRFGKHVVDFELTEQLIHQTFANFTEKIAIVPGFISSDKGSGDITNLGRGGSDYTAAIIAASLNAQVLEIWTDVDGFMTADPRVISKTYVIDHLSFAEAMELCNFGAKVVYPPTIYPVYHKNIPIIIKNTFNPTAPGTLISDDFTDQDTREIKGISSINDTSLVTVSGLGMVGVIGVNSRIFNTLAKNGISVFLVAQSSSEHNTTFAVKECDATNAVKVLRNEFAKELSVGEITSIEAESGLATVAVVGENMKHTPGVAGKLFNTLGKNGINVVACAQGASEMNISFVVDGKSLRKALNVIHDSFFLSECQVLNLFIIGTGHVGRYLIEQIRRQQEKLKKDKALRLNVVGISNSRSCIFDRNGIDINDYHKSLTECGKPTSPEIICEEVVKMNIFNSVFVDCTANPQISDLYATLLSHNVNIVAANKIAASSAYSEYANLKQVARKKDVKFLFETNVGAGLPIINTINSLINSGDRILKIEAVLSGTLNYIFNILSKDIRLSQAIRMAMDAGYSEPDPREDLSGKDVIRKLVILSRESGYKIEVEEVAKRPIIPESLMDGSLSDFFANIKSFDDEFEKKRQSAEHENKRFRFVAKLENGKAEVGIQEVDRSNPFYALESSNNVILITTDRYKDYPMEIKGYGAGAEVTAAGVFADIISIANIR